MDLADHFNVWSFFGSGKIGTFDAETVLIKNINK